MVCCLKNLLLFRWCCVCVFVCYVCFSVILFEKAVSIPQRKWKVHCICWFIVCTRILQKNKNENTAKYIGQKCKRKLRCLTQFNMNSGKIKQNSVIIRSRLKYTYNGSAMLILVGARLLFEMLWVYAFVKVDSLTIILPYTSTKMLHSSQIYTSFHIEKKIRCFDIVHK